MLSFCCCVCGSTGRIWPLELVSVICMVVVVVCILFLCAVERGGGGFAFFVMRFWWKGRGGGGCLSARFFHFFCAVRSGGLSVLRVCFGINGYTPQGVGAAMGTVC